jgi:hypothetical protein
VGDVANQWSAPDEWKSALARASLRHDWARWEELMNSRPDSRALSYDLMVEAMRCVADASALGDLRIADVFCFHHGLYHRPVGWRETGQQRVAER